MKSCPNGLSVQEIEQILKDGKLDICSNCPNLKTEDGITYCTVASDVED